MRYRVVPLIGFTGLKGSGKDTAAETLDGYTNVKMAGALKAMLAALYVYQGLTTDEAQQKIEGVDKEFACGLLGGRSPRQAMQTLGTDWGRNCMAPDFWVQTTESKIWHTSKFGPVVVTDIRFPNEVDMIRRLGGLMIRVDRAGLTAEAHVSESHIFDLPVDGVIRNTAADADEWRQSARAQLGALLR